MSLALMENQTNQLIKLINLVTIKPVCQKENFLSFHIHSMSPSLYHISLFYWYKLIPLFCFALLTVVSFLLLYISDLLIFLLTDLFLLFLPLILYFYYFSLFINSSCWSVAFSLFVDQSVDKFLLFQSPSLTTIPNM